MKITKIALFVMLGVSQYVLGSEGNVLTTFTLPVKNNIVEKADFFIAAQYGSPFEKAKMHLVVPNKEGINFLPYDGQEEGAFVPWKIFYKATVPFEVGNLYVLAKSSAGEKYIPAQLSAEHAKRIAEEIQNIKQQKKEKEKTKSVKTTVLSAALAQHQADKKSAEETSQPGKKITKFHTLVSWNVSKYDSMQRTLIIKEIKDERRLCLKDEITGLSIVLNDTHVNQLRELYNNKSSQAAQERWFCSFSDNTKVLINNDYSALDEMFKTRDTTRVPGTENSDDDLVSHPDTQVQTIKTITYANTAKYTEQGALVIEEAGDDIKIGIKNKFGNITYLNDIAVNQLYGIYQNGEMSLFASFLTLFFDLTDGSKILANVKGEQLAKLKRYLVLKNTKYVSEEKDFLEWIFNENAVFDETYKKENGWIVTDVERKVGDQLQYKAILFIHAQTGECIAEMVAVKKEDGSLDTSSVSMEKFTVDGMVAESIIKKVNSQQSVMLLFTSKDNKIADVFCEVTGVIQAPRSKIWVSGVFPHKDGINLYCQNGQVVALPPQESRRLIDSCRFCFRAKDSDTKVQMTVNYNGNTYELIFDSSLNAALEGYKKTMTKNSLKVNKADYPTEKYTGTRGVTQLYAEQKNEKIEENLSTSASWLKSTKWIGGGIVTAAFFLSVFYYMYKNGVAFGDVASELAKMVKFKA